MSTNSSIDGWAHHVDAAVRLTTLRGNDQFNNSLSYAVFRAVRTMMVSITHIAHLTARSNFN